MLLQLHPKRHFDALMNKVTVSTIIMLAPVLFVVKETEDELYTIMFEK